MYRVASATLLLVAFCYAPARSEPPSAGGTSNVPQITDVRVSRAGEQVQVVVRTSTGAAARGSRLSNPDRIVIDFPGFQGPTRRIQVNDEPVMAVRTAMYQVDPPVARVVIDVSHAVRYEMRPTGITTLISVSLGPPAAHSVSLPQPPAPRKQTHTPLQTRHIVINEGPARAIKDFTAPAPQSQGPLVTIDASGLITVKAERCRFVDVLRQIAATSGAQIETADDQARNVLSTAGEQPVTVNLGPATSRELVKSFFQGSPMDYIVIESATGDLQKIVVIANSSAAQPAARTDAATAAALNAEDNVPPTVTITSPGLGTTVSGEVTLSAKAEDNVGVAGVQFNVDGKDLGAELTSEPYEIVWDTASVSVGTHVLGAVARDHRGNANNAPTVIVNVVKAN